MTRPQICSRLHMHVSAIKNPPTLSIRGTGITEMLTKGGKVLTHSLKVGRGGGSGLLAGKESVPESEPGCCNVKEVGSLMKSKRRVFFALTTKIWFGLVLFPRRVTDMHMLIRSLHLVFGSTSAPQTDSV